MYLSISSESMEPILVGSQSRCEELEKGFFGLSKSITSKSSVVFFFYRPFKGYCSFFVVHVAGKQCRP